MELLKYASSVTQLHQLHLLGFQQESMIKKKKKDKKHDH